MGRMQLRLLSVMALLLAGACADEHIGAAQYGPDQCRRLAVIDTVTGDHLHGAEDFALDARRGRLFISAYDRRAVEKASRRRRAAIPSGGVYAVTLSDVFDPDAESVTASPLAAPGDVAGGLRPHGIAYDARNNELVFINRTYQRINNKWLMTPRLQRIGANGEMFVGAVRDAPCAANDVLMTEQQTFTSFDHGACNWRAGLEDIFNLKRSGLVSDDGKSIFSDAAFANGLTQTKAGDIVMAATREKVLIIFSEQSGGVSEKARIAMPGGPDNLSISYDGGIVAAAHPSLWRLGLNRKLGVGKAPSRIVKADPETGAIKTLFDDPAGKLLSAATVAIETNEGLVAGSVTDKGILVCRGAT